MTNVARVALDATQPEGEYQAQIMELAELCGWKIYHTFDSRRSHKGWPDLTLVRGTELLFLEVKGNSKSRKGTVTREQGEWIAALKAVNRVGAWAVWPEDWAKVEETLKR